MADRQRWASRSEEYERHIFSPTVPPARRRMLVRAVRGPRVLDLGAGPLPYLDRDLLAAGHQVVAADWSPEMLAASAARLSHARLTRVVADHLALPFPSGTFDTVVAVNSILPDDPADVVPMLREARRVLRPGGRFVGLFPAWESLLAARREYGVAPPVDEEGTRMLTPLGWQWLPTRAALLRHLRDAGWSGAMVRPVALSSREEIALLRAHYGVDTTRRPMREHLAIAEDAAHSLDAHLAAVATPALPPELFAPERYDEARRAAAALPAALAATYGFECRLEDGAPEVDFALGVLPGEEARALAGLDAAVPLPAPLRAHPVWRRVRALARRWADPASPLHGLVRHVQLELDGDARGPAPVPSVFLAFDPVGAGDGGANEIADRLGWLFGDVVPALTGRPADAALARRVAGCAAALPPGAVLHHVGLMLGRRTDALRLSFGQLPPGTIAPYLSAVGWPGAADAAARGAVERAERAAHDHAMRAGLSLDIRARSVGPRAGVRIGYERGDTAAEARLPALLDWLVAERLCTPPKRAGLLAWRRALDAWRSPGPWPDDLRQQARALGDDWLCVYARWLHHVKVVAERGAPARAKAYLALERFWLDAPAVRAALER